MIRQTLSQAKAATFAIELPNTAKKGMPTPRGTGFFVSGDWWFVTAAHVVSDADTQRPRDDLAKGWLTRCDAEPTAVGLQAMCQFMELDFIDFELDFALIRVDFEQNAPKDWVHDLTEFPHAVVSSRELDEGESVYATGYPLSESVLQVDGPGIVIGTSTLRPRVTSAIISATRFEFGPVMSDADKKEYVLDKALNFGNSGGPIFATDTGRAHAFCSRFQPVRIPQRQFEATLGPGAFVYVPSLYGVVTSLANPRILDELVKRNVAVAND